MVEALSYAIDDQDRLIKFDQGYYRFAEENGWDRVGESLGRSLWNFVAGEDLRKLQRLLLRRIRDEVRVVDAERGRDTLEMCGWCDRFLVDGEWVEVEEAAVALDLFRRSELPAIDHGVCPRCSSMLLAA
jgi:hypothetical protein